MGSALRGERELPRARGAEPPVVGRTPQTTANRKANIMKTYILRDPKTVEPQKQIDRNLLLTLRAKMDFRAALFADEPSRIKLDQIFFNVSPETRYAPGFGLNFGWFDRALTKPDSCSNSSALFVLVTQFLMTCTAVSKSVCSPFDRTFPSSQKSKVNWRSSTRKDNCPDRVPH